MDGLKLFVVGQSSPDPDDWRDGWGERAIVLAHDKKEAIALAPDLGDIATEILTDRAMLILKSEIRPYG